MSALHWWFTFDRANKYFTFIASCRTKDYSNASELHKHHILPKSWFRGKSKEELLYRDSPENIIVLSYASHTGGGCPQVEDHVKAHELLYEIYKNPTDLAAVQMLKLRR